MMKHLWTHSAFRHLFISQLLSNIGDQFRTWAIIFWVFDHSGSSTWTQSLLIAAELAPAAFLGPFTGVFVDRWSRVLVIRYSNLMRAVLSLAVVPALYADSIPWVLTLISASAVVAQFSLPATQALLPSLLPQSELLAANSATRTVSNAMILIGPALGTALYQWVGASRGMMIDATCYGLAFFLLCLLRPSLEAKLPPPQIVSGILRSFSFQMREGLVFAWKNSTIRTILLMLWMMSLGIGVIQLLSLFFIRQTLELSEQWVAWGSTTQSVGMVLAALLMTVHHKRIRSFRQTTLLSVASLALSVLLLAIAPTGSIMLLSRFAIGASVTVMNVAITTLFMSEVPSSLLGRVGAVLESSPSFAVLLSVFLSSTLVLWVPMRLLLSSVGALFLGAALLAWSEFRHTSKAMPQTKEEDLSTNG